MCKVRRELLSGLKMRELLTLHEDLVSFGSEVQGISNQKYEGHKHIGPLFFDLGTKISSYVITLHRAVLSLYNSGWTHITPLLLRGMLESTVNYLTVLNSDESEYMAFKYFSHDYFRVLVDPEALEDTKDKARSDIRHCMTLVGNAEALRKAEELNASILSDGRTKTFWFQPEISNLYDCISRVSDIEMKESLYFVYRSLSMSIHGTHLGMFMFRDNPDDFDINPSDNSQKAPGPLLISYKLLLEFLICRCKFEQLALEATYSKLLEKGQNLYIAYRSTINT